MRIIVTRDLNICGGEIVSDLISLPKLNLGGN